MDVDNLLVGQRFDMKLAEALDACDVLVAVIGSRWTELLKARTESGERDYVREEIAAALKRGIVVIPVRVGREDDMPAMPRSEDLPEDIRELVLYQKHDVMHERFGRDMAELGAGIVAVRKEMRKRTQPSPIRAVVWGWVVATAAGMLVVGYFGTYYAGIAVPGLRAPPAETRGADAAARAKADAERKARAEEIERLRAAAAKVEEDRKKAEEEAAKQRADREARRKADEEARAKAAAEADAKRKAEEAERQRLALLQKQEEDRKKAEEEAAKQRADREARRNADEEARAKVAAAADAKRKAEESERQRLALLQKQEEDRRRAEAVAAEAKRKTDEEAARRITQPGQTFRDCTDGCPEMVMVPAGSFTMGSPVSEQGRDNDEGPQHTVTIRQPFAVGKFEVTFDEWAACVASDGCSSDRSPSDQGWGRGKRPVINVSWNDAKEFVAWLTRKTGKVYRLLSEAEWEYAARAGTTTSYFWGNDIGRGKANCDGCRTQAEKQTEPVGLFRANAFGLHDLHGNVWELVEDCWNATYQSAPADGSARDKGDCSRHVIRGGSWYTGPKWIRSAKRDSDPVGYKNWNVGFRVARKS
jgi:formylglycine-generating enzyme required for sulfatase activity